jgi:hypothetical protein
VWTRHALLVVLLLGVVGIAAVPRLLARLDGQRPASADGPQGRTVADLYSHHFRNARHERMFLASIAFFVAFAVIRVITHLIRAGRGPRRRTKGTSITLSGASSSSGWVISG